MTTLIGRKTEYAFLKAAINKGGAQLIAITGRRRIGKTFLVRSCVKTQKARYFEVIGKKNASANEQIDNFLTSFEETFGSPGELSRDIGWHAVFKLLSAECARATSPFIVFLDELPWLAEADPVFIRELEHIWNSAWIKYSQ